LLRGRGGSGCFLSGFGFRFFSLQITFFAVAFLDFIVLLSHTLVALHCGVVRFLYRVENMKSPMPLFNIILAFFALALLGCKTTEDKAKAKEASFVRFHLETNPDGTPYNETISIYRADPAKLTVEKEAALDERFMKWAEMVDVDSMGGIGIKITFDDDGTRRLDYLTTSNKGRHLAVEARWTESRWLAAPLITKRISNGIFIFTPDASREETQRIVVGLQNVIRQLQKPYVF
jgi:hypothetical protein